jgi:hypothetical protein
MRPRWWSRVSTAAAVGRYKVAGAPMVRIPRLGWIKKISFRLLRMGLLLSLPLPLTLTIVSPITPGILGVALLT